MSLPLPVLETSIRIPAVRCPTAEPAFSDVDLREAAAAIRQGPLPLRGDGYREETTRSRAAGWQLILPAFTRAGPSTAELQRALASLNRHRGRRPPLFYQALPNTANELEAVFAWTELNEAAIEESTYFLLAGDPADLPSTLYHFLSRGKMVGRLALPSVEAYNDYALKVIAAEGCAPTRPERPVTVFAPDWDAATKLSRKVFAEPVAQHLGGRKGAQPLHDLASSHATRKRLLESVTRPGEACPSLLVAACHGAEQPDPGDADQGALCDQLGEFVRADDVTSSVPFLTSGIALLFACNGAGTPRDRSWKRVAPSKVATPKADHFARLPAALLSLPRGPLAVVAHMDILFTLGLGDHRGNTPTDGRSPGVRPLVTLATSLAEGRPVGVAMRRLAREAVQREMQFSITLRNEYLRTTEPTLEDDHRLMLDWIRWNDAQGWITLGDPLVAIEGVRSEVTLSEVMRGAS